MTAPTTSRARRGAAAAVGALALAAAGLLGLATPAHAAVGEGNPATGDEATITLHKSGGDTTGTENNGLEIQPPATAPSPGVNGASYELWKADGIDLASNEGWAAANTLSDAFATNPSFGDHKVGTTTFTKQADVDVDSGTGQATVPIGLYVIVESAAGSVPASGERGGTIPAGIVKPFMIALPLQANASNPNFNYTPHIYLKSTTPGEKGDGSPVVTKTGATNANGSITWTISVGIPESAAAAPITKFVITDDLVGLTYVSNSVKVTNRLGASVDALANAFAFANSPAAHLTWTAPPGTDFKAAAGGQVRITLVTNVEGKNTNPMNKAVAEYNDLPASNSGDQPVTDGPKFSAITVTAKDSATQANLQGAKFEVYVGACGTGTQVAGSPITTSSAGTTVLTVPWTSTAGTYCLRETAAPAGYSRLATTDNTVTISSEQQPGGVTQPFTYTKIANVIPNLPVTGANGRVLLMAGGLSAVLLAGGLAMATRKRRQIGA